jgi:hypothetical protein
LRCDEEQALEWQLAIADGTEEQACDPDVARDLLRAWQKRPDLPTELFRRVLRWSGDSSVIRNWPAVAQEADQLLRDHALRRWLSQQDERHALIAHIRKAPALDYSPRLVLWYQELLDELSEIIHCFVEQADRWREDGQSWRQDILERELERLHLLATPLLILSDLYFAEPSGGWRFAMAMFGFSDRQRREWRKHLNTAAIQAVIRFFLFDARVGRTPVESIKVLTFGDEALYDELLNELDLLTRQFDSMSQRDLVARNLAPIYASYREQSLRRAEISRRYRALMRLLHVDSLQNLLPDADKTIAQVGDAILTLSVLAATSRKFLSARQASTSDLQTIIADDETFTEAIRDLRIAHISGILLR